MLRRLFACLTIVFVANPETLFAQRESYAEHPDSVVQPNVPQGKLEGPFEWTSRIFPGTVRNYWLYVPDQLDRTKPACVLIVQDGWNRAREWKLPTVMDNLIAKGEMPVTLGIFIDPGIVPPLHDQAQPRFNRSFEYDGLGDRYARFLIEEILPEVSKRYAISDDPNDRAIAGASSGAVCAFTAAWERPDQFRRVLSTIGTYVGLRGGDIYPTLIRKCEPKPIRIFLQDGSRDLNIYAGDWWVANLDMLSALQYAGYEVEHTWGEGGHNGLHAAAIMPDALRWIWKDYPQPVRAGKPQNPRINPLMEGHDWELVSQGHQFTEGPAEGPDGSVYFVDVRVSDNGEVRVFIEESGGASGLMFGPDGHLYAAQSKKQCIVRYDASGKETAVLDNAPCNDLVVTPKGIYFTDPQNQKVVFATFDGQRTDFKVAAGFANGLTVTPDHAFLHVADSHGRYTLSFQIGADGTLSAEQTYGYLHVPDSTTRSGADGMATDVIGNFYVASSIGIQVLDPLGRVNLIVSNPPGVRFGPSNLTFAGTDRDVIYATYRDQVFRRKVNAKGFAPWESGIMPPRPGL